MDRRAFLKAGFATAASLTFGSSFWRALASGVFTVTDGPYGPLLEPDANGVRLPTGFTSRVVVRGAEAVEGTSYRWHWAADGGATFATPDGGWIYVSNSELDSGGGGAGALRFAADASIVDAYPILTRTNRNCAGGATPWGTWLSCEEREDGRVFECDPTGAKQPIVRPGLGTFEHEAAVVDEQGRVYLTEDHGEGRFYRFTPDIEVLLTTAMPFPSPLLSLGRLEVAKVDDPASVEAGGSSSVTWLEVPVPNPLVTSLGEHGTPTREQVPESTAFKRGEGAWFDQGIAYFATTTDYRIWAYDTVGGSISVLFDGIATPNSPLRKPDNITVARSGDVLVCEDGDDMQICILTPGREVAPLLQVVGAAHAGSEMTGVAFNPAGDRLYFSSQRGFGTGVTFEVTGPFRA